MKQINGQLSMFDISKTPKFAYKRSMERMENTGIYLSVHKILPI